MAQESQHVARHVDASAAKVYEIASDPRALPRWASGLAGAEVELVDGRWSTDSPMGRVSFAFAPRNEFGVLDHEVELPDGQVVFNPMRVIPDGDRCEVVFTLRRRPGMSDDELARDAATVRADLDRLAELVEAG